MPRARYYWQVCVESDGDWECLDMYESRAEAEAYLRSMKAGGWWPNAFLVRIIRTRMDQIRPTTTLTAV